MKKGLLIGGGIVVVAIVAVVIFLISSIDSIVKTAVEEFGSKATKTRVTLNEVEISTSGTGALRGFTMGNPAGFKTESAVKLGEIKIDIDVGSVTEDVVIIREIVIAGPEITYELGSGGSNIDAIQKNVEEFTGGAAKGGSGGEKKPAAEEEGGTRLIIENLYIRDGKVNVSATFLKGKTMTVPLPAIHLKDIGKEKGGASPGEVVQKIMAQVSKSAGSAVSSLNLGKAMDAAKEGVEGAKKMLEGGVGGAAGTIEKGAESIGGTLKGLFGK
jgi:hypothetical protein